MPTVTVILVLAFIANAHSQELTMTERAGAWDSMDKFVNRFADKLVHRVLKSCSLHPLHHVGLDRTTMGKSGTRPLPMASQPLDILTPRCLGLPASQSILLPASHPGSVLGLSKVFWTRHGGSRRGRCNQGPEMMSDDDIYMQDVQYWVNFGDPDSGEKTVTHRQLRRQQAERSMEVSPLANTKYTATPTALQSWLVMFYPTFIDPRDQVAYSELVENHCEQMWYLKYGEGALAWTREYDDDMFLNYVLPITHFDESPGSWAEKLGLNLAVVLGFQWTKSTRRLAHETQLSSFYNVNMTMEMVDSLTLEAVANKIAKEIWDAWGEPPIEYRAGQTPAIMSVEQILIERDGPLHQVKRYGSSTALSILLVNGLRSVGVPARVVGIGQWNRPEGGAYNWVEVWFNGKWNYIDAVPGVTIWNGAWFTECGLAQNSKPFSIMAITTPVWNSSIATGKYYITWDRKALYNQDTNRTLLKEGEAVLEIPAIDLTEAYAQKPRW